MTQQELLFPVESIISDFDKHMQIQGNNRILFSGKFGSGKSTFLNEYFNQKKEKYNVFSLYPKKYEISSNENIIKYIQADIIAEMLEKHHGHFYKIDILYLLLSKVELIKLTPKLALSIMSGMSCTTDDFESIKDLIQGMEHGLKLYNKIGKPLGELMSNITQLEEKKATKYIEELRQESPFISNKYTNFIQKKLNEIKISKESNDKENILIIDDLDRIDPQHVFEIINVFSVHLGICDNENEEATNKYGFDKIILVADYENLISMFKHFYGQKTDEKGYFDKFYSIKPYSFSLKSIVTANIKNLTGNIRVSKERLEVLNGRTVLSFMLSIILVLAFTNERDNSINLRDLMKLTRFTFPGLESIPLSGHGYNYLDKSLPELIKNLHLVFGGKNKFENVIEKAKQNDIKDEEIKRLTDHIIKYFNQKPSNKFEMHKGEGFTLYKLMNYTLAISQNIN